MLIWINGTYGVGKTSVAKKIIEKYSGESKMIEPDELWINMFDELREEYKEKFLYNFGGFYPQNNKRFLKRLDSKIKETIANYNGILIIPMTITEDLSYKELIQQPYCDNIKHIVLQADKNILLNRIKKDEGRDVRLAISNIEKNDTFLKSLSDIIFIDTTYMSVEEVAEKIIEMI